MTPKIQQVLNAIEESDQRGAVKVLDYLSGFSGNKLLGALQRTTNLLDSSQVYCEIGVFQGMSLVSVAAANPEVTCIGIDNFALFDAEKKHRKIIEERAHKAQCSNIILIESDYEKSLDQLQEQLCGRKIGVFFIDGPHDYRSQFMCLMLFKEFLSENAVVFVDDSNYSHVRQANSDFLKTNKDCTLIYEKYTHKHPNNMNNEELAAARDGWWNGINIIFYSTKMTSQQVLPVTYSDRLLHENEHILHSMKYAEVAPAAVRLASTLKPLNIRSFIKALIVLKNEVHKSGDINLKYNELNMRGFN